MLIPEQTADGSYTLFVPELNEHYHSIKGALNESIHIFISMGLRHSPIEIPRILEIGFGTGLNAFLTLLEANRTQRTVHYTTIERYPVPNQLIDQLHYPENISPNDAGFFHALQARLQKTTARTERKGGIYGERPSVTPDRLEDSGCRGRPLGEKDCARNGCRATSGIPGISVHRGLSL